MFKASNASKKFSTFAVSLLLCLSVFSFGLSLPVKAATDTALVTITILAPICNLNVLVRPEKRIPRTGNWDTLLNIWIYRLDNTLVATVQGRSDDSGLASFNLCSQNIYISPGNYNFYVRGFSHLQKAFPNQTSFTSDTFVLDLTTGNQVLLAGETSNIYDNKINSLDASTQIRYFYNTTDEKNDLNRDGKVNSLDFSNTVYNFYKLGNPMP